MQLYYILLNKLKPEDPITQELQNLIHKWAATDIHSSWGNCKKTALEIKNLVLEVTDFT